MDPSFIRAHLRLGETYSLMEKHDLAIKEVEEAVRLSEGYLGMKTILGQIYAKAGKKTEALKLLNELNESCKNGGDCYWGSAFIYGELGNRDAAFKMLEEAFNARAADLAGLKVHPSL